jgi:hypothetical protein
VEHRPHLVEIAEGAAARLGVDVRFKVGTLDACDPREVDGVYFFNPFAENLSAAADHLDQSVELSAARFWRDVHSAERFLSAAAVGTRVVTYCGWGGSMPSAYRRVLREGRACALDLWVKTNAVSSSRPNTPRLLAEVETRNR